MVERTLARLTALGRRGRQLACEPEQVVPFSGGELERAGERGEAMVRWAGITTITRRIVRGTPARRARKYVFTHST
ncbi:hypothetical protein Ae263Ps1_3455c [Pseudonocardia sp. Ae263_Ps1]|nr:hypothetical protein Ae150APs1_1866 [Pseudonocardia sp. Ae150A_Ps1]OLL86400.1 hypothetical protein Ae263Ps1_3455c [Pseudonocardia sp. Ae263_Ps1]OLL93558.1 hypothetical protein Ae356Ps1_3455 [Pseudonocardia sp. Ae356_Ps1]